MGLNELYELAERLHGRPVPGERMTEAEFVDWCPEELRAEWVDGEVILMSPVGVEHDELDLWLSRLIGDFVEERDLGVIHYNVFVRLATQRRRRVPDLMFISRSRLGLLKRTSLDGAPDLIVEIISPDSQSRDRREKYQEYEKAGVCEYWIIDPLSQTVELYRLRGKKFVQVREEGDELESCVLPKFRLKPAMLWRRPLPKVASVLRQMRAKK
jgi:Uma2 family endonuclease